MPSHARSAARVVRGCSRWASVARAVDDDERCVPLDRPGRHLVRRARPAEMGVVGYITSTGWDFALLHLVCMIFSFGVTAK